LLTKSFAIAGTLRQTTSEEFSLAQISNLETLVSLRPHWRSAAKSVVWTNGCFDLLHAGHVRNLREAKAQGDILVVGINSDRSVRQIKGKERPIVPETQRAEIVAAIDCVDYVVIFEEQTPIGILRRLQPDVHCKGADYADGSKPMPEAEVVRGYGGRIAYLDLHLNCSTTAVIEKIRSQETRNYDLLSATNSFAETDEESLPLSIVGRLSARCRRYYANLTRSSSSSD
jgi:D-glycero-beta-D-manno-heptose 1-phosphate adenylyltransferase